VDYAAPFEANLSKQRLHRDFAAIGRGKLIGTAEESVLRMPGTQPVTFSGSMPSCLQIARAVFFLLSLCRGTVLF
jgi:hypothetical protein